MINTWIYVCVCLYKISNRQLKFPITNTGMKNVTGLCAFAVTDECKLEVEKGCWSYSVPSRAVLRYSFLILPL
jgi:hypothetical protein